MTSTTNAVVARPTASSQATPATAAPISPPRRAPPTVRAARWRREGLDWDWKLPRSAVAVMVGSKIPRPLRLSRMGAGKIYRLGRIFGVDARTLILPVDHGVVLGRVQGLEDPVGRLDDLLELPCDGLLMAPGLTRH